MVSIEQLAKEVRDEAADVVKRHQKLASLNLYRVLARCLEVAERCALSHDASNAMRRLVASEVPPGRSRAYVEHSSDEFVLVCRYVLNGESHANLSRYSNALREAKKMQLHSSDLFAWLKDKGGVNALFLRRPTAHNAVNVRHIRLDKPVTLPKSGQFTLVLERLPDGYFTVVEEIH